MKYDYILIRYGELALKSKYVRNKFELKLIDNIRHAFKLNNLKCDIRRGRGRFYLKIDEINKQIKILKRIFGIVSFSPAIKATSKINDISDMAVKLSKKIVSCENSFALRVTRTGIHDYTSQQVAVKIGNDVVKATKASVNLNNPDFEFFIEIRDKDCFFYTEKISGVGGLPLNSQGQILSLISNLESILAAWYLMRRGCAVSFVLTDKCLLNDLTQFSKNWYIDLKKFLIDPLKDDFFEKLNKIASEGNYLALVTYHNFNDDKNNTVTDIKELKKNLKIPILHPLIAMDKDLINLKCTEIGITI